MIYFILGLCLVIIVLAVRLALLEMEIKTTATKIRQNLDGAMRFVRAFENDPEYKEGFKYDEDYIKTEIDAMQHMFSGLATENLRNSLYEIGEERFMAFMDNEGVSPEVRQAAWDRRKKYLEAVRDQFAKEAAEAYGG